MATRVNIRTCLAAIVAIGFAAACREITVPDVRSMRGATGKTLLNPSGRVVVYPDSMRGWSFYYDQTEAVCTTSPACRMVLGPGTPPLGSGSAEFEGSSAIHGKALILADYAGTRFDEITDLRYSTYRQTADTGNRLAISLEFNVDYNLNDPAKGYQGRLVFEPSAGIGGNVSQNSWQTWDARAGKWWGTKAIVTGSGASAANPCVQATPCTWAALLAAFPSIGVHSRFGAVIIKAGTGWSGFRGNVDKLTIAIAGISTTYDFELTASPLVPASAPATPPWNLITAARIIRAPSALGYPVFADLVQVRFAEGTPVSERVAAVAAVGGSVVGGYSTGFAEGYYVLQLSADSSGMLIRNAMQSLRSRSSVANTRPVLALLGAAAYSRSNEGTGLGLADWILNPDSAFAGAAAAWAASAVAAPFAWGCATGTGITGAIIDMGLAPTKRTLVARESQRNRLYASASRNTEVCYRSPERSLHGCGDWAARVAADRS